MGYPYGNRRTGYVLLPRDPATDSAILVTVTTRLTPKKVGRPKAEYSQAMRLLRMHDLLHHRQYVTIPQLMEQFSVDRRTIQRDVEDAIASAIVARRKAAGDIGIDAQDDHITVTINDREVNA